MFKFFRTIVAVLIIAGLIFAVTNYSGLVKKQIGVKGASTDRAKEISGRVSSDIGEQADSFKKQILEVKIVDILNGLSKAQKIPDDIKAVGSYVRDQMSNVLKSKK